MKFKILLLVVFAAGLSASLAFADGAKPHVKKADCQPVHLEGTVAPQSLAMTVTRGSDGAPAAGSQVTLAVGTTGQTVRINVEACTTGSGSTLQYVVKHLELQPLKPKPAETTTGTTTGEHEHGDKPKPSSTTTTSGDGEHEHKGGTTTTATTTTAATTTSPTTTTTR